MNDGESLMNCYNNVRRRRVRVARMVSLLA